MAQRRRVGRMITVDVAQFRGPVHVREDGPPDAPTLLLLHGFSGSMHWFDLAVPLLADEYRVIRLDLPGHGATGGRAVDAPVHAAVTEHVLAALDISDATAIGHSFGADVAVELAEQSPRISRLVIVAQAPDYSDATFPRAAALVSVPVLGAVLPRVAQGLAAGVIRLRRGRIARQELLAQALADFRALNSAMLRIVLIDRRDRMAARPLDAQVAAAGKPTLVILGERDHFYGARSEGRYRAAGAAVHVLADTGHSPFVERPREVVELIRSHVATTARRST